MADSIASPPPILAANAFYYYRDLDAAWRFYTRTLGFRTVADYGFAKMLQVSPTSYLTLVDEARGMHSSDEPKSVTLAMVTEQVEGWWEYLDGLGLEMTAPLRVQEGRAHDGFVAIDPEGYLLEFERFNSHPENVQLRPILEGVRPLYPDGREVAPGVATTRPAHLGVQATVLWLYYTDLERIQAFYREALGAEVLVDQGWARVLPASPTGFLGLVDGTRGLHTATPEKAVTVSFFTTALEPWLERLERVPGFTRRPPVENAAEGDFVQTFVGHDPEGYFLERTPYDPSSPYSASKASFSTSPSTGSCSAFSSRPPARVCPEESGSRQGGESRAQQDPHLGVLQALGGIEGQAPDEQGHGEADPAQSGHSRHLKPGDPGREVPEAAPHRSPREEQHAQRLAHQQAESYSHRDRVAEEARPAGGQPHPGIGEGEQGDDEERHPGMQAVLQPGQGSLRRVAQHLQRVDGVALGCGRHGTPMGPPTREQVQ